MPSPAWGFPAWPGAEGVLPEVPAACLLEAWLCWDALSVVLSLAAQPHCLLVPSTKLWRSGHTGAVLGGWWLDDFLMITMHEQEQIPPVGCKITL